MKGVIGVAWYKDEVTYHRARGVFADPENMPSAFEDWKALVGRQCELIRGSGNVPLRADIDPEAFLAWCELRGFPPNSAGRIAFVNHVVLEYEKTGMGRTID